MWVTSGFGPEVKEKYVNKASQSTKEKKLMMDKISDNRNATD